jgi:hypothetical protein
MEGTASDKSLWSLQGTVAQMAGDFSGEVDVARPQLGIRIEPLDQPHTSRAFLRAYRTDQLLPEEAQQRDGSSAWPLPVADAYVRGNDLVATYGATDDWPYSPQLYWQAGMLRVIEGVLGSLSLLVSVQTHLLNTWPMVSIGSSLGDCELLCLMVDDRGVGDIVRIDSERTSASQGDVLGAIYRWPDSPVSYAECVMSGDAREISFRADPQGRLFVEWRIFADFLEKGVIRRARVNGALLPRENDVELALECCRAIEQCPLPLTA